MTLTLDQARTQSQALLDSSNFTRWSQTEVDIALQIGYQQVLNYLSSKGDMRFQAQATLTPVAGILDISSLKAQQIQSMRVQQGQGSYEIKPAATSGNRVRWVASNPITVIYTPSVAFPTVGSDPILYNAVGTSDVLVDGLMCAYAAAFMSSKEGGPPQVLQANIRQLEESLTRMVQIPSFVCFQDGETVVQSIYYARYSANELELFVTNLYY